MADAIDRSWPVATGPYSVPGVTLALAADASRWSLRTHASESLPDRMLAAAPYAGGHALHLGPDEWLLILPLAGAPPALDHPHALTDVSHRSVGLTVEGEAAALLLQTGVALDLAEAAFPPGKVTRTLFEMVEIVLWRETRIRFRVEVWRSFAPWLWSALELAAADLKSA